MTFVVNLFGGPGVSKSTTAALAFGKLKTLGVNAELVTEFAKDLTWEDRRKALKYQPYVLGKQSFRIHRLMDKVDVIVTDSPILLSDIYQGEGWTEAIGSHTRETFRNWPTMNFFLNRDAMVHPYNPKGRSQSAEEAEQIDYRIKHYLDWHNFNYELVGVTPNTSDVVVERVKMALL